MKDKIIHLIASEDSRNPMTDEEIAETLGIFRETVTNIRKEAGLGDSRERRKAAVFQDMKELLNMDPDLTERGLTRCLAERGYVIGKYAVGKLKEELLKEWQPEPEYGKTGEEIQDGSRFFSKVIGYAGSMKSQIKQVQAAILYPPKGLHCLLYGPSGVGKSYLAEIMHEYAVTTDNFASDAPYFAFNCADYADNPQLLLSQLFGYSKGAFTGASENKKGIVEQCDGGILFLDEVHRLPPEGQEILFYLMDKGKFRRLGETEAQRESHLMIIAATTEDPRSSLLLTFRRRIPMMIEIPSLKERPLKEKLQFIRLFFWIESRRLNAPVLVRAEVIRYMADEEYQGNVGQLKADIQVCCARAFLDGRTKRRSKMIVGMEALSGNKTEPISSGEHSRLAELVPEDEIFTPDMPAVTTAETDNGWDIYRDLEERYSALTKEGLKENEIEEKLLREIESSFQLHIRQVEEASLSLEELSHITGSDVMEMAKEVYELASQRLPYLKREMIIPLAIHLKMACERLKQQERIVEKGIKNLGELYRDEYEAAKEILNYICKKYYVCFYKEEAGFLAMYFHRFQEKHRKEGCVGVAVVSHGPVASAMAEVANSIMGVSHAVGVDMGIKDTPVQMAERTMEAVRRIDQGKGVLILADMGSLLDMEEKVKKETGITVKIVGRTDTMMVIEAIRRTYWTDESLETIAKVLDWKQFSPAKRQTRKPREKAVLCLCITGEGAARMLKSYLEERLKSTLGNVRIITKGYIENTDITELIRASEEEYEILAIAGTIDPKQTQYPFLSVSEIYAKEGIRTLRQILKRHFFKEQNCLQDVIFRDLIFIQEDFAYKEQILDQCVEAMAEKGLVQSEFLLSVYKREGMMPTFLKGGIAIPHGAENLVTKPVICITKLDKPIVWDGFNTVDLVCVLALNEKSTKYFEQFYQVISDEIMVSRIRSCHTLDEIYGILCNYTKTVK